MKTLDDIVEALSPEEREQFKDLIAETRERDKHINDSCTAILSSLKDIAANFKCISAMLDAIAGKPKVYN